MIWGCSRSDWDGVKFFHSSPYGAVLCICGYSSADNTPVFWLLLSCACTVSRPSLFPTTPPQPGWEWARGWDETQLGQSDQREISCDVSSSSEIKTGIEEEKDFFVFKQDFWLLFGDWLGISLPSPGVPLPSLCLFLTLWTHLFFFTYYIVFLSQLKSCLDFVLSIFSSIPLWRAAVGSELRAVWVLGCRPGCNHHSESNWKPIPDWCTLFSDSDLELAPVFSVYKTLFL